MDRDGNDAYGCVLATAPPQPPRIPFLPFLHFLVFPHPRCFLLFRDFLLILFLDFLKVLLVFCPRVLGGII